ncbi:MAG: PD-(D/E)XK nuclease family protein [Candidatus Aenigmarchaeota archaeon]|nr:PD-(D/E)XK nuclease family protein [Candidatus Aenigmarchaeota archaeon]
MIEQLTRMIMDGRKPSEKDALELLKRRWDPKGYGSKLDEKRDYDEGKDILKTFLKEQTAMKGDIVDIERSFTTDVDGIKMTGRIDRIDKDGEDYTVIDYKTAKKVLSEKEIREDLQLLMYSLVTEKLYGKKPSRIGIWFLRHNKKVFVEVDGASLEAMKADVKAAVEKIMSEAFDPTPGWECKNCDYDCLCDARKM